MNSEDLILTDNGKRVLKYLQSFDENKPIVGKDIGEALSIKGIYPVLTSLFNKGLLIKGNPENRKVMDSKGKEVEKEYITYLLSDKGINFNIK